MFFKRIKALEAEINVLRNELISMDSQVANLKSSLSKKDEKYKKVAKELTLAQRKISRQKEEINRLRGNPRQSKG